MRTWFVLFGLMAVGCGPSVGLPGGEPTGSSSTGQATGMSGEQPSSDDSTTSVATTATTMPGTSFTTSDVTTTTGPAESSDDTGWTGSSSTTGEALECAGDDVSLFVSLGLVDPPEDGGPLMIDANCQVTDAFEGGEGAYFSMRYALSCDEGQPQPTEREVRVSSNDVLHEPLSPGMAVRLRVEKWFSIDYGGREYVAVTDPDGEVLMGSLVLPHSINDPSNADTWFPMEYTLLDDVCPVEEAETLPDSGFIADPCLGDETPMAVALNWDGQAVTVPPRSTIDVDGLSISMHALRRDFVDDFTPCGSDGDLIIFVAARRESVGL